MLTVWFRSNYFPKYSKKHDVNENDSDVLQRDNKKIAITHADKYMKNKGYRNSFMNTNVWKNVLGKIYVDAIFFYQICLL